MEQPQLASMQTEFSPANHYYPDSNTTYSQNGAGSTGNTDGQNLNAIPVYQQNYTTPHQMYGPQDMNHNIPNYTQDMHTDPFKPHYEYDTDSQGHQTLVYNNTDSGLGYESNGMVYNGDVSMNYYSDGSSGQFGQAGTQPSPPAKRGPGRPTKKNLSPGSSDKSFICETCFKPLGTYQSLKKHMVTHTGLRQYKCDLCVNTYTQKHNLTKHLRVHSGERPYACSHCPASYRTSHLLKNHMNKHPEYHSPSATESEEKSNDSEFMDSSEDLNNVDDVASVNDQGCEETNTLDKIGATADKCEADSVRSVNQSDKSAHKLEDQSETDDKELVNQSEKGDKKTEPRSGAPGKLKLECNQCDQTFESRVKLTRHKNEHNSQKTLSCNFCNASFRWKASFDIHMRKHKGKKQPSYQLKGLKIKNGNRITLKIVNAEKKNADSGSDSTEKKPVVKATVKLEEKSDKVQMTNLQASKDRNKDITKSIENHDVMLNNKKTTTMNPIEHNHGTRMRNTEAIETKKSSDTDSEFIGTKPTKPKKFECNLCGQMFTQNFSLKRHKANKICTR